MTTEELLALPASETVERELLRGRLKERETTRRGRRHTRAGANLSWLLRAWLAEQAEPRGEVLVGEAGFRLRRDPDTTVGIDLAYIDAETSRANPDETFIIDGVPVLVVEILSPSDTQSDILDKVAGYLDAGVNLVWVAEPTFRTLTIYRSGSEPAMLSASQEISGEPNLPRFRAKVAEIFD